jgi:uncharacterized protein (DUF2336 family)
MLHNRQKSILNDWLMRDRATLSGFSTTFTDNASAQFQATMFDGHQMLTSNPLLGELETSIRTGSQMQNADTLRRVTDLFLHGAEHYSQQQIDLFEDVFSRLVERIEARALGELSDRLAPADKAPPGIIRRLANDDTIEVAAPVLTQSPVLTDGDLADIARTKSQDHLLAVSKREVIAPPVTDILIDRGNTGVVQSVAGNSGAAMSESGYAHLIDKTKCDEALVEIVASRSDISLPGLRRLLKRATRDVCARLLQKVGPEFKEDVHTTLLRIFDRVDNDIHRERDTALHTIEALRSESRLDAKCIFEFCRAGQLAHATAGLAHLSDSSFELVAEILDSGQNPPLMVACKAAGVPWSITFSILKSRPHQQDIVEFQFDQLLSDYCRLTQATARRALRFWQIRQAEKSSDDSPVGSSSPSASRGHRPAAGSIRRPSFSAPIISRSPAPCWIFRAGVPSCKPCRRSTCPTTSS